MMLQSGAAAPDFALPALDGSTWGLTQALQNGPIALVFFKTGCPTCQYTFPYLERLLAGGRAPGNPQLIGVSQDDAADSAKFRDRFGLSMTLLTDEPRRYPASNLYRITHVPSIFLIEPDGKVSLAFAGFHREKLEELGQRFGAKPFRDAEQVPAERPG
jgi:peroxiredoxin